MASPAARLIVSSGAAILLAVLLATPTIAGISTWKVVLGLIGLILFVMSGRRATPK
jgi:hypothetical protein